MTRRSAGLLLLTALVALPACSRGPVPVPAEGTITRKGKPIKQATVQFHPLSGGRLATGVTDEAGKFRLTTLEPDDGAFPGEYKVTVTAVVGPGSTYPGADEPVDPAKIKRLVPENYGLKDSTPLKATVGSPPNSFPFDIK